MGFVFWIDIYIIVDTVGMLTLPNNEKAYQYVIYKRNVIYDKLSAGFKIVEDYIKQHKLILVGGMAIDYALKLKGSKLYEENTLPDYDCFSVNFYKDAYKLGKILCESKLPGIDAIGARHLTTFKVRLEFEPMADITYISKNIYDKLPTLNYNGFLIIHPWYQMINQHHALCNPYRNAPTEVFSQRWKKDMKRYDMLYEFYPLELKPEKIEFDKCVVDLKVLKDNCICGITAFCYWVDYCKKNGMKFENDYALDTIFDVIESKLTVSSVFKKVSLLTDNIEIVNAMAGERKYYNSYTDIINRRCEVRTPDDIILEVFDNYGNMISAHKTQHFYVANLQHCMLIMMCNFLLSAKSEVYGLCYLICREMLKWSKCDKKHMKLLFPSIEVFGEANFSENHVIFRESFPGKDKNTRPKNVYFKDECVIPEEDTFDLSSNPAFAIDWLETKSEFKKIHIKDINMSSEIVGAMEVPEFPYFSRFVKDSEFAKYWNNLLTKKYAKIEYVKGNVPKKIICNKNAYAEVNVLTNKFSEPARMKARINGNQSPLSYWKQNYMDYADIPLDKAREMIWANTKEATLFNCVLSKTVYDLFCGKRVLDPFMGWGDRMIGALASDCVEYYCGYDINAEMKSSYESIVKFCDKPKVKVDINICDFLEAKLEDSSFDLVFTSPPYFDFEIYGEWDSVDTKYAGLIDWTQKFLTPVMKICYAAVKPDGILAIHIGDTYRTKGIGKMLCDIMKSLGCEFISEIECWNESSKKSRYVPLWMFKKVNKFEV